jgi:Cu(I)/Ag(I) efflux system periplasmic protein CusF
MQRRQFTALFAAASLAPITALTAAPAAAQALPKVEAEVRTIHKDAGTITLKHGEITNLDMGAMTMVFQVKDKSMLEAIKEGDKVKFTAGKIRGQYTVMSIEKQ